MSRDLDIESIIAGCLKGDRRMQYALYKRYYGLMISICLRYQKNKEDAEFLLNEAFFKVLKNLDQFPTKSEFDAWLSRITINTAIDSYRKTKRDNLQLSIDDEDNHNEPTSEVLSIDSDHEVEELMKLVQGLPDASRQVFNMFAIDGFKHSEIAKELGISEGTSKWHLNNARNLLKEKLNQK